MNDQTNTNTNTTSGTPASTQTQTCANCGMSKEEWMGNNGQGFQMGDKTFCCQGCATGTGCTCQ
jgi:hypothetical protein